MAEGAFFIMIVMILLLVFSIAAGAASVVFASILTSKPNTRILGRRIFLMGIIGILIMNILVIILRTNVSVVYHLPRFMQVLATPLLWMFHATQPVFAYPAATFFGFAWAAGIASLSVVFILVRRKPLY
ncbi:hypothetical protein JW926_07715 [Candidatus Sumerlaeota bacterium]|nr:hypothetical protein [Candidatus Sumerlaeota bacterium]